MTNPVSSTTQTKSDITVDQSKVAKDRVRDAAKATGTAARSAGSTVASFARDIYSKVPNVPLSPFRAESRAQLTAIPGEIKARLGTERVHATNTGFKACLLGAAACVAGFTALVYKDIAIELFKGILLHDALLMAAIVLTTLAVVNGVARLFKVGAEKPAGVIPAAPVQASTVAELNALAEPEPVTTATLSDIKEQVKSEVVDNAAKTNVAA